MRSYKLLRALALIALLGALPLQASFASGVGGGGGSASSAVLSGDVAGPISATALQNTTTARQHLGANDASNLTAGTLSYNRFPALTPGQLLGATVTGAPGPVNLPSTACTGGSSALGWTTTGIVCNSISSGLTTGTSGHVVSFLDGNNTYSGVSTFSGLANFTGGLQINGVATAPSATTDTTNASNISSGALALGRIATIGNNTVLGNVSGITAVPSALTATQLTTLVNAFTSSLSGAAPASGGGTTNFLRADGTWAEPSGVGTFSLPLGPGLTNNPGTVNGTPLTQTSIGLFEQTYPVTYLASHTMTGGESGNLTIMNSSSAQTFTLPQAGTTGFAAGAAYNFLNIGSGALSLSTSGSAFNGMPTTGSSIVLNQYGYAACVPDASANWNCAGNATAAPSATNLGATVTSTSPSINGDISTGFYTAGAGKIDAAISGVRALELTATSVLNLTAAAGKYQINGNTIIEVPTQDNTPAGSVSVGVNNHVVGSSAAAYHNVAIGVNDFGANTLTTAAIQNVAIGYNTLYSTTTGSNNLALGNYSGYNTTTGHDNVFLGGGYGNATGNFNTQVGSGGGNGISNGSGNTLIGYRAGYVFTGGSNNTIIGANVASTIINSGLNNSVLIGTTTGTDAWTGTTGAVNISCGNVQSADTCVGYQALSSYSGAGGSQNSVYGYQALNATTTGSNNAAFGYQAGKLISSGSNNLVLGYQVGSSTLTTGSSNILLGTSTGVTTPSASTSNYLNIGNMVAGDTSKGILILRGPTTSLTCGTSPTLATGSNDMAGEVTVGTSSSNSCAVTFANAHTQAPRCVVSNQTNTVVGFGYSISTSALTVTATSGLDGAKFDYFCPGSSTANNPVP